MTSIVTHTLDKKHLMDLTTQTIFLLLLAATLAGFIDTLAGGGGLITIPALALSGAPMLMVLGTNKLQGTFGTATASLLLYKRKKFTLTEVRPAFIAAFIGALVGSLLVQIINKEALKFIVPLVLLVIGCYFLLSPYIKIERKEPLISNKIFNVTLMPIIGFYDGMFGPGTGSFFSLAAVSMRCQQLVQATTFAKPLNFATNIASLIIFISLGKVMWLVGAVMIVGQITGASIASHFLYKIKPEYLRIIVILICFLMLSNYMYREFGIR